MTTLDTIEKTGLEQAAFNAESRLASLHEGFKSSTAPEGGRFSTVESNTVLDAAIRESFMLGSVAVSPEIRSLAVDSVRDMYSGVKLDDRMSLGLKEIGSWKINPEYRTQNLRQHAGYAAEVISTYKENLKATAEGTGVITKRIDDLTAAEREAFGGRFAARNDQFADKVRIRPDGTYEIVQTKFVGKNAEECLSKLISKKYEKYTESGKVDKLEIPKDYFDDVKTLLREKKDKLLDQHDRVCAEGKTDAAKKLQKKIGNIEKLDDMLEQSVVTSKEAVSAVKTPRLYAAKQLNAAGLKQGAASAVLTAAVSSVDNYGKYRSGEIDGKEAATNVLKDSAVAGGIGYVSEVATQLAGHSSVPAAAITMAVESFNDVKDYIDGEKDGEELAYDLGKNAASTIGGVVGGLAGGAAGTFAGPVGTAVGGMAGSALGSAAAVKAYEEVTEFVDENIDTVIEKGGEIAGNIGDAAAEFAETAAEKAGELKDAAAEKASELKASASEAIDSAGDKISDIADSAKNGVKSLFD